MSATMTTVNGILKEVYEGNINDQLNEEQVLLKRIEKTSDNVTDNIGGKYVVFPVRSARNHGISYRAENIALAAAGKQGYKAAQESLKYGYGRVRITGQTMKLAETNAQAFSSALDGEMDGLKEDLKKDQNRIAWGQAGSTGILATLTSSPAGGTTFTVSNAQWLEEGMILDIVATAGPTVETTAFEIASISGTTITTVAAVTGTSGSVLVRTGNYANEPYGIFGQIVDSTGALHALNPATAGQGFWASQEDSTTTTLTELAMITMADNIRRAGGSTISAIFCSLGVRRSYWNILTGLRRYNEPKKFDGGLVGLSFMYGGKDIPVVEDPDALPKSMLLVTESEIKLFQDSDWYWEDTDGSVFKWVTGYDAFEALMKKYWQLGTHKRNAHGKFSNITEASA